MQLTLDIPDDIVSFLQSAHGNDLARSALEQLAIAGYRAGTLSRYHVQRLLGFESRWETEEWLGECGAAAQYSVLELDQDRDTLEQIFGQ